MLETVRSVLSIPAIYRLWGHLVGGSASVRILVNEYIQPSPCSRILEIGCGPGAMIPFLPHSGYLGFDLSSEYIDQARRRFPDAEFVCERVSKFSLSEHRSFDIALAIGVIHHLEDEEALQLFKIAYDALRPGGRLVTIDGVFTDDQSAAARWLLERDRGAFVRRKHEYLNIAEQVFPNITPTVRQDLLRIPFTHLILQCFRPVVSAQGKTA